MTTLSGLGIALRIAWRRNWLFWIIWILVLASFMPLTISAYDQLIPPGESVEQMMAALAANPTMKAILGHPFDLSTPASFTFWRVGGFTSWAAGIMTGLGVIRITRAEEEAGRVELIRSGAVGRHAPLAAAVIQALLAAVVLGAVVAATMMVQSAPAAGSLASGAAIAVGGWMFAGLAAVIGQVFESSRSVRVWTLGLFLGGQYLIRALVDGRSDGLTAPTASWYIPLQWPTLLRPYADERWWVLMLPIGLTAALVLLAFRLESIRDHGGGLIAAGMGRPTGSAYLKGAGGLSWRLQRSSVIGWLIGVAIAAVGIGSLGAQMEEIMGQNAQLGAAMQRLGGSGHFETAYYVAMLGILAIVIALAPVMILGRLRGEEQAGHAEIMLSTATSRPSYALSHLIWALVLPTVLLIMAGSLMPILQAVDQDVSLIGDYTRAALALLPGVWLAAAIGIALIGWAPRLFGLTWVVVGWTFFCGWIAALLELPDWLIKLELFGYLPKLPVDDMNWAPVLIQTAIACVGLAVGLIGFRQRNIPMV